MCIFYFLNYFKLFLFSNIVIDLSEDMEIILENVDTKVLTASLFTLNIIIRERFTSILFIKILYDIVKYLFKLTFYVIRFRFFN